MNKCTHFPRCGGCNRLNVPYREQLCTKLQVIKELFSPFTGTIPPVIPSPEHYYYRHKVQLPFGFVGKGKTGRPIVGCYAADSHSVVDQQMCFIQDRDCSRIAWTVRNWVKRTGLSVYNERKKQGFLRHILLRKGTGTGEVLIGLITNGKRPEGSRQLARILLSMLEKVHLSGSTVVGIIQNVNTRSTNVVLGQEEHVWWGRPYLKEVLGTWKFKIELSTFFQVNPFQTPQLYNEVLRNVAAGEKIIDCYCGVGSIALWISHKASSVRGIEENRASVQAARTAAKINKVTNVSFVAGDAHRELLRLSGEGYTCAVVDPPRKGLGNGFAKTITDSMLKKVVYVSCDPHTLKRDVTLLQPAFNLTSIQGVDMFPHTDHIECVAVLNRQ